VLTTLGDTEPCGDGCYRHHTAAAVGGGGGGGSGGGGGGGGGGSSGLSPVAKRRRQNNSLAATEEKQGMCWLFVSYGSKWKVKEVFCLWRKLFPINLFLRYLQMRQICETIIC
jgi:hypothetical protein